MHLLERQYGKYQITKGKSFKANDYFDLNILKKCFDFAYNMAFSNQGEHRSYRSGGSLHRAKGEIFINTFQGKLAEYAMWHELEKIGINLNEPDTETYGLGEWDDVDLEIKGFKISVKSTKKYGQLLLLECKDWDEKGVYKPNREKGTGMYNVIILVRIAPSGEDILRANKLLYAREQLEKKYLKNIMLIDKQNLWCYDIPGFITYKDLVTIIDNKRIIRKGSLLGANKTQMDADNYYVQAGSLRDYRLLMNHLNKYYK